MMIPKPTRLTKMVRKMMRRGRVTSVTTFYTIALHIMRYAEGPAGIRRHAVAGCAAALLLALASVAAQPAATAFDELEAAAKAELQATNAPGAAIAVVKGDRIVYQKGVGVANIETGQ